MLLMMGMGRRRMRGGGSGYIGDVDANEHVAGHKGVVGGGRGRVHHRRLLLLLLMMRLRMRRMMEVGVMRNGRTIAAAATSLPPRPLREAV